jgi:hypothetical protein
MRVHVAEAGFENCSNLTGQAHCNLEARPSLEKLKVSGFRGDYRKPKLLNVNKIKSLYRWYINTSIMFLDIIHRLVFI